MKTGAGSAHSVVAAGSAAGASASFGRAVQVAAMLAFATLALLPAVTSLERYWSEIRDYRHGYLVVTLVAGWIVWHWRAIGGRPLRPVPMALPLLAALVFVWLVAWKANSLILMQLLWPAILLVTAWSGGGHALAYTLLLPLGYLYFAVPVWDHLVPMLQWLTVEAVQRALSIVGVPMMVDGNFITLRDGTFEVAEGCAGKRYFMITLAVAMAAGMIERLEPRRMVMLMFVAALLAIGMNWIRVLVIILAGHLTEMQHYLVAVEHETFGWALFVLLIAVVLVAVHRLRPTALTVPAAAPPPTRPSAPPARSWLPAALLLAVPLALHLQADGADSIDATLGPWPVLTDAVQGPLPGDDAWSPRFQGASVESRAAYRIDGAPVEVYGNVYGVQAAGRELVSFANSPVQDRWVVLEQPDWARGLLHGPSATPRVWVVASPHGEPWLVALVYRVGGHATGSEIVAQLLYGVRSLAGPVPAGAIVAATPCDGPCSATRERFAAFWNAAGSALLDIVPAVDTPELQLQ